MPEKETLEAAREDLREGKSPSTAAGEFVREEVDHVREGQARRAVREAGDCDRSEQGTARGHSVGRSEPKDHVRRDAAEGSA